MRIAILMDGGIIHGIFAEQELPLEIALVDRDVRDEDYDDGTVFEVGNGEAYVGWQGIEVNPKIVQEAFDALAVRAQREEGDSED